MCCKQQHRCFVSDFLLCLFPQLKGKKPPVASNGVTGRGKAVGAPQKRAASAAGVTRTPSSKCLAAARGPAGAAAAGWGWLPLGRKCGPGACGGQDLEPSCLVSPAGREGGVAPVLASVMAPYVRGEGQLVVAPGGAGAAAGPWLRLGELGLCL